MIFFSYLARNFIRASLLVLSLLLLITFLDHISRLTADGLGLAPPLLITHALVRALFAITDFMPIIFMLAGILALTTLSQRAELQIIRNVGISGGQILAQLSLIALLASLVVTFALRPLSFEAQAWSLLALNAPSQDSSTQGGHRAWFSANDGKIQGRLSDYNTIEGTAAQLIFSDQNNQDLGQTFAQARNVRVLGNVLRGQGQTLDGATLSLNLKLDSPPKILPPTSLNLDLPLAHLIGWVNNDERILLPQRQRTYLIQRALAEPLLAAALVFIAGAVCMDVSTRQSIGRLVFSTLGFVVLSYCVYVIAHAFGINGKLRPAVAAWGLPLALMCLGLALLGVREWVWHLAVKFRSNRRL